jgi:hypothetical protein
VSAFRAAGQESCAGIDLSDKHDGCKRFSAQMAVNK